MEKDKSLIDLKQITPIPNENQPQIQTQNDDLEFETKGENWTTSQTDLAPYIYTKNLSEKINSSLFITSPYTIYPKTINSALKSFLSFTVQPLKKIKTFDEEIPPKLINKAETSIARCELCKGYLSPFCILSVNRSNWICKLCNSVNKIKMEYFNFMEGSFDENEERIELTREVFEYRAPGNYFGSYDVHKDKVIILVEISNASLTKCNFFFLKFFFL